MTSPMVRQRWRDVSFIHWPYQPGVVRELLPAGLEPDTFEGAAWVGLTPFAVERSRLMMSPPLPGLSSFPETNVRTYVIGPDGRDGLWFFTLEADSLPIVTAARGLLGVPYRWAEMNVDRDDERYTYASRRRLGSVRVRHRIVVRPGDGRPVGEDALAGWLTGRWRAWTRIAGRFSAVPAQHEPWPLVDADVVELEENVIASAGLPAPVGVPVVHFSPGVSVRLGWPQLT